MIENQKTVSEWATREFGYPTRARSIARMVEEVDELKDLSIGNVLDEMKVAEECADILITLYNIADTFGFDLHACVDHKMSINRARKWKRKEDGTGYHVKE